MRRNLSEAGSVSRRTVIAAKGPCTHTMMAIQFTALYNIAFPDPVWHLPFGAHCRAARPLRRILDFCHRTSYIGNGDRNKLDHY